MRRNSEGVLVGLLTGVRILDITNSLAGAMATQVLADHDATIVRVDRVGALRQPHERVRLRGRRSVAVDCAVAEGEALAERLAAASDVVLLEPGLDGRMRFGADAVALVARYPRLVVCRITAHGDQGPLAGAWFHDHLVAARYGLYQQVGWREGPTYLASSVPSLGASLLAVQAIGTALYVRERTGRGQVVSASLLAGALACQPGIAWADGAPPGTGTPGRGPLGVLPFYRLYECADGEWLHFGCLSAQFQQRAAMSLGLDAELRALGFGTPDAAPNHPRMIELVAAVMRGRPFAAWAAQFERDDIPYARSQWAEDLLDDPQVAHEGLRITVDDPTVGPMQQMGVTAMVAGQAAPALAPAPVAGQHTDVVLSELGLSPSEIAGLRQRGVLA